MAEYITISVINAENASLKAKKLALMAKRTREQLLKNFCETLCTSTTLVPNPKKSGNPGRAQYTDTNNLYIK